MMLHWQWPWAIAIAVVVAAIIWGIVWWLDRRHHTTEPQALVFDIDDDLATEEGRHAMHVWRRLNRFAALLASLALIVTLVFVGRPSHVTTEDEQSSQRDIVLCLDVSGSALPYDQQVIDTYRSLLTHFKGERIGLSIFNSTSRTVFPLTNDYAMVSAQLTHADEILRGVATQDDIDQLSDQQYQDVSDWLEGTQNKKNATSLIGDGLVSCAAMVPGFTYGSNDTNRDASIVLATDNVVSGKPTYTLAQALDLTSQAGISVDGLFSGPTQSENDQQTQEMKQLIEEHHGVFLTQSNGASVEELVRSIDEQQMREEHQAHQAALSDAPGWWTLAIAILVIGWFLIAWRLRR